MTNPITTPAQMREAAARCCEAEADKCDDAAKWGGSKRYVSDCKAAAYAMLDRAAAIRALPVAEPERPAEGLLRGAREALAMVQAEAAPQAVRVKKLEWEDADEGMCTKWRAAALGGHYELVILDKEDGLFSVNFRWGNPLGFWFIQGEPDQFGPTGPKKFPSIEAAKAAAEADHAARILSQIDAVSVAQVRAEALREADYFGSLVLKARTAATKASIKFPQPNYVTLKIAEEAGEVVRGAVHYAEGRMEWAEVEGEIVQLLAMLIRFVTEGDEINGVIPPVAIRAMIEKEPT